MKSQFMKDIEMDAESIKDLAYKICEHNMLIVILVMITDKPPEDKKAGADWMDKKINEFMLDSTITSITNALKHEDETQETTNV